eukprot:6768013-Ditylum_brightwellii.AAC.1
MYNFFGGVPNNSDCPKHGSNHTSSKCCQNPFKKKGRQFTSQGRRGYGGQGHHHSGRGYANHGKGNG